MPHNASCFLCQKTTKNTKGMIFILKCKTSKYRQTSIITQRTINNQLMCLQNFAPTQQWNSIGWFPHGIDSWHFPIAALLRGAPTEWTPSSTLALRRHRRGRGGARRQGTVQPQRRRASVPAHVTTEESGAYSVGLQWVSWRHQQWRVVGVIILSTYPLTIISIPLCSFLFSYVWWFMQFFHHWPHSCRAARYRQETLILERSAVVHGYSFQPVGLGQPFSGVGALAA